MKRYVIVQESWDESGQRGVDAVYAGLEKAWDHREANLALGALQTWLEETRQTNDGTRVTIVQVTPVPDRPRGLMARAVMEAEQPAAGKILNSPARAWATRDDSAPTVEGVTPPVTSLWAARGGDGS